MGKRSRRRGAGKAKASRAAGGVPHSDYEGPDGMRLRLRGSLTPGSRRDYANALGSGLSREDAEQRAFELLFERLAVSWTVAGVPTSDQRELLGRLRMATPTERQWVRETLRSHCAEWFPDVQVP